VPDCGVLVLVDCGGLGPQVEFGTVGLDFAPDGESADSEQHEYQQFLHGEESSTSIDLRTGPRAAVSGSLPSSGPLRGGRERVAMKLAARYAIDHARRADRQADDDGGGEQAVEIGAEHGQPRLPRPIRSVMFAMSGYPVCQSGHGDGRGVATRKIGASRNFLRRLRPLNCRTALIFRVNAWSGSKAAI